MQDQWAAKRKIYESMNVTMDEHIPSHPSWTVAEFGVGRWGFGRFYAERFAKVYGIDIEDYSEYHPGVQFVLSDGGSVNLPDETVHVVVSHSVLEHVSDLRASMSEINRITKNGGYFFLTVNPLYYSGFGAHLYENGKRLEDWQHLDPQSKYYMCRNPFPGDTRRGHDLNMLTSSMFISESGNLPWTILHYEQFFDERQIPSHLHDSDIPEHDLRCIGFRFVGRKKELRNITS